MSRSYWKRWHWELQKRREAMALELGTSRRRSTHHLDGGASEHTVASYLHEINPADLVNPEGTTNPMELWIGRGTFSVVKLQVYRGMQVAVKELLPQAVLNDVCHEAMITMKLCHRHLPYLFGVCTLEKPYVSIHRKRWLRGLFNVLRKSGSKFIQSVTSCPGFILHHMPKITIPRESTASVLYLDI